MADDLFGIGEATTEISKGAIGMIKTLLGPAADEAGQILADRIRYWRWKNSLVILEEVNQTLIDKGITPRQIPLKTLMPIMEGISVEDESENLKAKWVNLISHAATGESVHPKYIKLFSELDSIDATILDTAFSLHKSEAGDLIRQYFDSSKLEIADYPEGNLAVFGCIRYLKEIKERELDYVTVAESIRYLEQLNLIKPTHADARSSQRYYAPPSLSTFGLGFLRIVSEPEKLTG